MSDLYPSTCPAWVTLLGAYAPAGIVLWVFEVRKLSHHEQGMDQCVIETDDMQIDIYLMDLIYRNLFSEYSFLPLCK